MTTYFGKVCSKHPELLGERRTNGRSCIGCARLIALAYAAKNRAKRAAYQKEYRAKHPEVVEEHRLKYLVPWLDANKDYVREEATKRMKTWRKANAERVKQLANRPGEVARRSAYRAQNRRATPAWANPFYIEEAYHLAKLRAGTVGGEWQVDHIVPLRSKVVCGLHVENNFQVILKAANSSKGNRYWPLMP